MKKVLPLLAIIVACGYLVAPAGAIDATIHGTVHVIDGDTFDVGRTRIRLFGIDAPEGDQTCLDGQGTALRCGDWVSRQVRQMYQGQTAQCQRKDIDRYGRTVARCTVAGMDIGQGLVARGLAFAYAEYSELYVQDEIAAIHHGRGIHAYHTQRPSEFRAAKKAAAPVVSTRTRQSGQAGCTIKGNISAKGIRIFHVSGQRDYLRTSIRTDKGERWFCSADQARAAGWRAARR